MNYYFILPKKNRWTYSIIFPIESLLDAQMEWIYNKWHANFIKQIWLWIYLAMKWNCYNCIESLDVVLAIILETKENKDICMGSLYLLFAWIFFIFIIVTSYTIIFILVEK